MQIKNLSRLRFTIVVCFSIIISFSSLIVKAQGLDLDKVLLKCQEINTIKNAIQQEDSLFSLSGRIMKLETEKALSIFKTLDETIIEPRLKIQFYRNWSIVAYKKGNVEEALHLRQKGLKTATAIKKINDQFDYANYLSIYYINSSKADSASYYTKKQELLISQNPKKLDKYEWVINMRNANIQAILGDTKKQGEFLELAYEAKSKYPPDSNLGFVLFMVNDFFRQLDIPDKRSKYAELLINHYQERKINTPNSHMPIKGLLLAENTPNAIESLKKVIQSSEKLNNINTFSTANLTLSRAYIQNNEPNKAVPVLLYGIKVLKEKGMLVNNSSEIALLQEVYAITNDYENAYYSVLKQKSLEDSLRSKQTLKNIAEYEVKYNTQKAQLDLERKNAAQKLLYFIIGAILILSSILLYFFLKNKKKNKILAVQKKELKVALNDKEILLKEIHHRVKNNLQVVSSLLSLQQRQSIDPKASQAIQVGRDRVKAMSLIHQNLYQEGNLIGVSVKDYIDSLANSLVTNYSTSKKQIDLQLDVDAVNLKVDTIIPVGLIINELISNALKYAFTKSEEGIIEISLQKEEKLLLLSVSDNGIGLPKNFSAEKSSSLGYRLIKAFSEKLKAELSISSTNIGTQITLEIPYTT